MQASLNATQEELWDLSDELNTLSGELMIYSVARWSPARIERLRERLQLAAAWIGDVAGQPASLPIATAEEIQQQLYPSPDAVMEVTHACAQS